jgi:hypothetical protein
VLLLLMMLTIMAMISGIALLLEKYGGAGLDAFERPEERQMM